MPEMWARRENRAATNTAFRAVFFVCRRCGRGVRTMPQQTPLSGRCFLYAGDVGEAPGTGYFPLFINLKLIEKYVCANKVNKKRPLHKAEKQAEIRKGGVSRLFFYDMPSDTMLPSVSSQRSSGSGTIMQKLGFCGKLSRFFGRCLVLCFMFHLRALLLWAEERRFILLPPCRLCGACPCRNSV